MSKKSAIKGNQTDKSSRWIKFSTNLAKKLEFQVSSIFTFAAECGSVQIMDIGEKR